jgi:hypothetical protein
MTPQLRFRPTHSPGLDPLAAIAPNWRICARLALSQLAWREANIRRSGGADNFRAEPGSEVAWCGIRRAIKAVMQAMRCSALLCAAETHYFRHVRACLRAACRGLPSRDGHRVGAGQDGCDRVSVSVAGRCSHRGARNGGETGIGRARAPENSRRSPEASNIGPGHSRFGVACKIVGFAFPGSNPGPATTSVNDP